MREDRLGAKESQGRETTLSRRVIPRRPIAGRDDAGACREIARRRSRALITAALTDGEGAPLRSPAARAGMGSGSEGWLARLSTRHLPASTPGPALADLAKLRATAGDGAPAAAFLWRFDNYV